MIILPLQNFIRVKLFFVVKYLQSLQLSLPNKTIIMPYTTNHSDFIQEQETRLRNYFNTNREKLLGFGTKEAFINWYMGELYHNECKCHYCNTSILDIRHLLNNQVVLGRNVRGAAIRGANMEIDRMNPDMAYEPGNCVLSCYYCNNDKSNTFSYEIYRNVIGPTRQHIWMDLTRRLN